MKIYENKLIPLWKCIVEHFLATNDSTNYSEEEEYDDRSAIKKNYEDVLNSSKSSRHCKFNLEANSTAEISDYQGTETEASHLDSFGESVDGSGTDESNATENIEERHLQDETSDAPICIK